MHGCEPLCAYVIAIVLLNHLIGRTHANVSLHHKNKHYMMWYAFHLETEVGVCNLELSYSGTGDWVKVLTK